MQAITPALPYLKADMLGLDYGCGPTPTLAELLENQGLHCENFDPYFYPAFPEYQFDFIFSTEVVEHFYQPEHSFQRMTDLLLPGGILTIMTEPWVTLENFSEWHYAKDNTHVSFYHTKTISFIAKRYGLEILNNESPRVTVLRKNNEHH
jgi:SAM-dependent methyltransferase